MCATIRDTDRYAIVGPRHTPPLPPSAKPLRRALATLVHQPRLRLGSPPGHPEDLPELTTLFLPWLGERQDCGDQALLQGRRGGSRSFSKKVPTSFSSLPSLSCHTRYLIDSPSWPRGRSRGFAHPHSRCPSTAQRDLTQRGPRANRRNFSGPSKARRRLPRSPFGP